MEKVTRRRERGFTLIEVLIVVVIIGVLAALVIPRFVATPEKAIAAEANQMLGSMIRAQQSRLDAGGAFLTNAGTFTGWTALGMVAPTAASKFTYSCATSPECIAARTPSGGSASSITFNATTNTWACTVSYATLTNGGCTLA